MRGLKWLRPKYPSWQSRWSASLLNPPTGMVHASLPKPILIIFTRRLLKISPRSTTSALAMQPQLKNTQHNSRRVDLFSVDEVFGGWKQAWNTHFAPGGVLDRLRKQQASRPSHGNAKHIIYTGIEDGNASENGSKINQNQLQNIAAFSSRFPSRGAACHIAVAAFQFQFPSFLSTVFLPFSVPHMNRHASRMPIYFSLARTEKRQK